MYVVGRFSDNEGGGGGGVRTENKNGANSRSLEAAETANIRLTCTRTVSSLNRFIGTFLTAVQSHGLRIFW